MAIRIRPADLEADKGLLVDFLHVNLTESSTARRFDWLYLENPHGRASAWIAWDETSGKAAGSAAAFPRRMRVRGKDCLSWNLGDFAIARDQRTLGPALMLQRACIDPVKRGEIPFCYDHPSPSMMAIYNRMGVPALGECFRMVRLLRVDRKLRELVPIELISRPASALANAVLAWTNRRVDRRDRHEVSTQAGEFGPEFTGLDARMADRYPVCGRRDADYLNWHYARHPNIAFQTLAARLDGELRGYLVYSEAGGNAEIADLFGEEAALPALVRALARLSTDLRTVAISFPVLECSPLVPLLRSLGFSKRSAAPVLAYTMPSGPQDGVVNRKENWFLSHGDRDL